MSVRLSKDQSRERMRQLRELWREWDPVGVGDAPGSIDEYYGYAGESMRFLETGAVNDLVEYLKWAVHEHMGLSHVPDPSFEEFAKRMHHWFSESWAGTHA